MKNRTTWTLADAQAAAKRIQASRAAPPKRETTAHLVVTLPRLLPGLNGSNGLMRQHYREAAKVKDDLLAWVKQQRYPTFGDLRVVVVCTRHYCGNAMDWENAASSVKHLMDALVKAGVIKDDSPKIIETMSHQQLRCGSKKEQKMTIEITSCSLLAETAALNLF